MGEIVKNGEIDLILLFNSIWKKKVFIGKVTIAFFSFGLLFALISPNEYKASVSFLPQSDNTKLGRNLGPLATIAGINLGGDNTSDIPPAIYPKISKTVTFKKQILDSKFNFEGVSDQITYKDYFENHYDPGLGFKVLSFIKKVTLGLPKLLLGSLSKLKDQISNSDDLSDDQAGKILKISQLEKLLFEKLEGQIEIEVNEILGIITISASMPEPVAAAELTQRSMELLQEAVIEYRINKTRNQLKFNEERVLEKRKELDEAQLKLASFKDQNRNVSSSVVTNQLEKLQNDYNLLFNVYSDLARQLEASKIQVKQDTPTFSIIDPIYVPYERSKPRVVLIAGIFTFIGIVFGAFLSLILNNKF